MVRKAEWIIKRKTPILKATHLYNIFLTQMTKYSQGLLQFLWKAENNRRYILIKEKLGIRTKIAVMFSVIFAILEHY